MIHQNNHIVASCSWKTIFDTKEKGVELQNKLSHWSEHHMSREINTVFNSVCPEEQTIKIKTLELDLGIINYENLTEELALKLKAQLQMVLNDIIMYPNKHGQSIEIVREGDSHLNMLKYFLLQGVMPWNYLETKGTTHQVFEDQITSNRQEVIKMIQVVGVHEYVRRRIAWQLKEASLKRIIESIEKSNHSYILNFSEEFIKIQEQETIVKTGIDDFKKNVWFWILNYLFAERGTMFNKIDFVRSNIQQMANHFNLEYNELFVLIEDAVDKMHKHSYVKTDFILILSILSQKESKVLNKVYISERELEQNWKLLAHFLQSANNRTTTYQKNKLSELIEGLSEINPSRFKKIIDSIDNKVSVWNTISKDVQVTTFKILYKTISPTTAEKVLEQVQLLNKFELQKKFNIDEHKMMSIGLHFLNKYKTKTYSNTSFLIYLVQQISHFKKSSISNVIETIVDGEISMAQKNIATITIFKNLKKIYAGEVLKDIPVFSKEQLITMLGELSSSLLHNLNTMLADKYYKLIRLWVKEQPNAVWSVLKEYNDVQFIQNILPIVFNEEAYLMPIFEKVFPKHNQLIQELKRSIDKVISEKTEVSKILLSIKKNLLIEGIHLLILNETNTSFSFIKLLFEKFKRKEGLSNSSVFEKGIQKTLEYFQLENKELSGFQKKELNYFIHRITTSTEVEHLLRYIEEHKNKQYEVAEVLTQLVHSKKINTPEFSKNKKKISSYLLVEGDNILRAFINEFTNKRNTLIQKYTSVEIEKSITESYWQCIADYANYKGDTIKFKAILYKAIAYFLEVKEEVKSIRSNFIFDTKETKKVTKKENYLYTVSNDELIIYLKQVIVKNGSQITIRGKIVTLEKLLFLVLEQSPQEIRTLFKETIFSKTQLKAIQSTISFQQFIGLITRDKINSSFSEIGNAIQFLYDLVEFIGGKKAMDTLENAFWKQTIQFIIKEGKTKDELKQLVEIILKELYQIEGVDTVFIIDAIRERNSKVPLILKEILITNNNAFEVLTIKKDTKEISKDSIASIEKGVLEKVLESLILEHKIPSWFMHSKSSTVKELTNEFLKCYPLVLLSVIRKNKISNNQLRKLKKQIDSSSFFNVLKELYPNKQTQFTEIEKLYTGIGNISIQNISSEEIELIVFEKLIRAWTSSNWKLLNTASIWKELLWEICAKRNIEEKLFFEAFNTIKIQLPLPLQITYDSLNEEKEKSHIRKQVQEVTSIQKNNKLVTGIAVPNAGLVILNSYFLMLFERLNLVRNKQFVNEDTRLNAVHYLQYVVTGLTKTEESLLALNKVLCGIPIHQPIRESIEILKENKKLIGGLLNTAISYWSAIGKTTANGFRGNWLVRNGVLSEEDDHWTLTVEKRPYDVLMIKSPFSFSIIKLPWMMKPLHVTWSY